MIRKVSDLYYIMFPSQVEIINVRNDWTNKDWLELLEPWNYILPTYGLTYWLYNWTIWKYWWEYYIWALAITSFAKYEWDINIVDIIKFINNHANKDIVALAKRDIYLLNLK